MDGWTDFALLLLLLPLVRFIELVFVANREDYCTLAAALAHIQKAFALRLDLLVVRMQHPHAQNVVQNRLRVPQLVSYPSGHFLAQRTPIAETLVHALQQPQQRVRILLEDLVARVVRRKRHQRAVLRHQLHDELEGELPHVPASGRIIDLNQRVQAASRVKIARHRV